ncbi:MAG: hypothetical protein OEW15_10490 [Nitrospirota bacterium]|nr:hypothetical protein [Nitrospirota bacterium]
MRRLVVAFMLCLASFSVGCTHSMHISNAEEYFTPPAPPVKRPVKLGVTSSNTVDVKNSRYVASIIDALNQSGNFERIIYPYNPAVHQGEVELIADINVHPRYTGSTGNFFLNWPGFLIFAPAIWGYKYHAELETQVMLTRVADSQTQQMSIPTRYTFRHAEMNRTWTEIGWFEVGIIPLISGFFFTDFDPEVTGQFISQVGPSYGTFVARKILSALPQPVPVPAQPVPAPPVPAQPAPITGMAAPQQ